MKKYFTPTIRVHICEALVLSSSATFPSNIKNQAPQSVLALNFVLRKVKRGKDTLDVQRLPKRVILCKLNLRKIEYAVYIAESDFSKRWNVYAKVPQLTFLRKVFLKETKGLYKIKFPKLWAAIESSNSESNTYLTDHRTSGISEEYFLAHYFKNFDHVTLISTGCLSSQNKYHLKSYVEEFIEVYKDILRFAASKDFALLLRQIKNGNTEDDDKKALIGFAKFALYTFKIINMCSSGDGSSFSNDDQSIDAFFNGIGNSDIDTNNVSMSDFNFQDFGMSGDSEIDAILANWQDSSLEQSNSVDISFTGDNKANTGNMYDDRAVDWLNEAKENGVELDDSYERACEGGVMHKEKQDMAEAVEKAYESGKCSQEEHDKLLRRLNPL